MVTMIQRETYINQIRPYFNTDLVKVLTGIRRSGKSVMLKLIQDELEKEGIDRSRFISFNFESLRYAKLRDGMALYEAISSKVEHMTDKAYIFIDEIQEVTNWEKVINSLRVDYDCDIYITGSNAKLLSGELATYLAGRYVSFEVYPFSFKEFLNVLDKSPADPALQQDFNQYIQFGGMPEIANIKDYQTNADKYLQDVYSTIMLKDIIQRNNIRNVDLLERIIQYVLANVGHTFSSNSLAKYFKSEYRSGSTETILNYLKACCDAFLFYKVKREDVASKRLLSVNEKYYIADHGIRHAILGNNQANIDQILENIVFLELKRRGYQVRVGKVGNLEIDFVAVKADKKIYVQVSYLLASEKTIQREFEPLLKVKDNYPKYVITMDQLNFSRDGVIHQNIVDFLLSDQY